MKSTTKNNIRLLPCFLLLLPCLLSFLLLSSIKHHHFMPKPSINTPLLLHALFDMFSYTDLKRIAHYLALGPAISDIRPTNTFPVSIVADAPREILEYIQWHADQMTCIRDEECYRRSKDKVQIMVWKCPKFKSYSCSGGGDRFRGMVSSLIIAMLAKHVFLLSWPAHPYPFITAVAPGAIDWRVPPHVERDSHKWGVLKETKFPVLDWHRCPPKFFCVNKTSLMSPTTLKGMNKNNVLRRLRITIDDAYDDLNRVGRLIITTTGTYGNILCTTSRWAQKYGSYNNNNNNRTTIKNISFYVRRILFRVLFKPSPITQALMHNFIGSNAGKQGYLSVHARTGIDVHENIARFKHFRKSHSHLMARNILQCVVDHGLTPKYIYFSSDSIALKTEFRQVAASTYNIQVVHSDLPAFHIARYVKLPYTDTVAKWFAFINIFVDFFALVNGTDILSNYSQFSGQARIMSTSCVFRFFSDFLNKTVCNEVTNIGV